MQNPEIDVDDIMRVLAYESSANPQTLGPAGIDFTEKRCRESRGVRAPFVSGDLHAAADHDRRIAFGRNPQLASAAMERT